MRGMKRAADWGKAGDPSSVCVCLVCGVAGVAAVKNDFSYVFKSASYITHQGKSISQPQLQGWDVTRVLCHQIRAQKVEDCFIRRAVTTRRLSAYSQGGKRKEYHFLNLT